MPFLHSQTASLSSHLSTALLFLQAILGRKCHSKPGHSSYVIMWIALVTHHSTSLLITCSSNVINKLIYSANCQRTWPLTWRITIDLRQDYAQDFFCEWLVRDALSCWQPAQSREQFSPETSSQQWCSVWGAAGAPSQGAQVEHFLGVLVWLMIHTMFKASSVNPSSGFNIGSQVLGFMGLPPS